MKFSLRFKLSAAFISVTLILFASVSIAINFLLERQFQDYVMNKQAQRIKDTVALISSRYNDWGGKWDVSGIESIGVNTLGEGLILRVTDKVGNVLWDAKVHNGGMCAAILDHMARNMEGYIPKFKGGYVEQNYPLTVNDTVIGNANIGYYGPYFYTDSDVKFLGTLNNLLLWSALLATVLSLVLGIYMAQRLSRPIRRVIKSAGQIAGGNYTDRVREPSGTKEIVELTTTINSLADTLGKQDKLRKRLTADVAHELRTPLATIQSHLEAMIDGIWQPDAARLASCHEETVRISRLVGDLEKLSKADGENLVLDRKRFDLSSLLKRIVMNFEGPFRSKGVALNYEPRELFVVADEDKISQVFVNLLSNALNYTPESGSVRVVTEKAGAQANISVIDTGIGISEEDLPHIFERFYRTDESRSRLTGGSGIGLAIAKTIVDAHRGSLTVASQPGRGSVFTVSLPV